MVAGYLGVFQEGTEVKSVTVVIPSLKDLFFNLFNCIVLSLCDAVCNLAKKNVVQI